MEFYKYQGTGNDFVLIDNRDLKFDRTNNALIVKLCDRRFGIGADGFMLLQQKEGYDFEMVYYNADGNEGTMCGNGGRCIIEFARLLGLVSDKANFIAIDGDHEAIVKPGFINLKMNDITNIEMNDDFAFLDTGSPHYVAFIKDVANYNVAIEGAKIRNNDRFKAVGTNVNFVEVGSDRIFVRTFERGVEGETYSCGTGVTAASIVAAIKNVSTSKTHCDIKTLGGNLTVRFKNNDNKMFDNVWLEGPATFVYKGEIKI